MPQSMYQLLQFVLDLITGSHASERSILERAGYRMFFVGQDSGVMSPRAMEKTYERSIDAFGLSASLSGKDVQY